MKQFTLENKQLTTVAAALINLPTNDFKTNRSKHKLLKLVDAKLKEYSEDEKELVESYADKNETGEFVLNENDSYTVSDAEDRKELAKDRKELDATKAVIVYGEYALDIKPVIDYIQGYEGHIDSALGQGLFDLIEAYEESEEK